MGRAEALPTCVGEKARLLGHRDAAQFQVVSVHGAGDSNVMPSMGGNLVLLIDGIDLVVCVVDEHVLRTLFLDALGGAIGVLLICALRAAIAVRDISRHGFVRTETESSGAQGQSECYCKFDFHTDPPLRFLVCPVNRGQMVRHRTGHLSGVAGGNLFYSKKERELSFDFSLSGFSQDG